VTILMIVLVVVVLGLAALVILPRVMMSMKTAKLKGQPAPTPHKPSAKRIRSGARTILYFYTPTCHACRAQDPVVSKLQKRFPGAIFKIDASKQREAASAYGVMGVPFMAFIEGGNLVSAQAGAQRDAVIAGFLAGDGAA